MPQAGADVPNTLHYNSITIPLHDDMTWTDEFAWRDTVVRQARTIAGALIVESAGRTKGRPITLAGSQQHAWLPRSTVLTLQAAAHLPGQKFTLTFRGVVYTVMFVGDLQVEAVVDYSDPDPADKYAVVIPLMEVEA